MFVWNPPLQNVSKTLYDQRLIQQPNRAIERRWTHVHVALRHAELATSGELLNRSHIAYANRTCAAGCARRPATASLDVMRAARGTAPSDESAAGHLTGTARWHSADADGRGTRPRVGW